MAAQGSEEQSEDVLTEAEEALVRPDPQFPGLLQELGEERPETGHPRPQQPVLCCAPRREDIQGDRYLRPQAETQPGLRRWVTSLGRPGLAPMKG